MSKKHIDLTNSSGTFLNNDARELVIRLTKRRKEIIDDDFDVEAAVIEYKKSQNLELLEKILLYNLPMVVLLTRKYAYLTSHMNESDLISIGLHTIVRIAQKYDPERNNKFSSYLSVSMNGELMKALDELRPIKFTYYHYVTRRKKTNSDFCIEQYDSLDSEDNTPIKIICEHDIEQIIDNNNVSESFENYIYTHDHSFCKNLYDEMDKTKRTSKIMEVIAECYHSFINSQNLDENERAFVSYLYDCLVGGIRRPMIDNKHKQYNISRRLAYSLSYKMQAYIRNCILNKAQNDDFLNEIINDLIGS